MSFTEMLEGVKLLTLEEKRELHQAVAREINEPGSLLDSMKPGMVAYMTPKLTVEPRVLEQIFTGTKPSIDEESPQGHGSSGEESDPLEFLGFEYKPGMVFQTGSMVTTDREGFRLICEAAGIPFDE